MEFSIWNKKKTRRYMKIYMKIKLFILIQTCSIFLFSVTFNTSGMYIYTIIFLNLFATEIYVFFIIDASLDLILDLFKIV